MHATRRLHAHLTLAIVGAILAWLLANPLLLAIPIGIGGRLVADAHRFTQDVDTLRTDLTVTQSLATKHVRVGEPTTRFIGATTTHQHAVDVLLHPALPAALTSPDASTDPVTLTPDTTHQTELSSTIAGRHALEPPAVEVTSRDGHFTTTFTTGEPTTLVVAPAGPREIHVGEGGERLVAAYGEHTAGSTGAGLDPRELRRYLPGDPTNRIDWKATARLNEPHIREFEAETDRETTLIIDARASMTDGPVGETKLDYARELALTFVESAESLRDPLGLELVTETATDIINPGTGSPHYRRLRTTLYDLEATTDTTSPMAGFDGPALDTTHEMARRLAGDDSAFASTLHPLISRSDAYLDRLDDRPLFATVRARNAGRSAWSWTLLITDDTDRAELRETVKLARRQGPVLVCLLPSILYERGGLADLDAAYDTYRDFESFRRQLAALDGVTALEVGPRDRLGALLTHHRRTRGVSS